MSRSARLLALALASLFVLVARPASAVVDGTAPTPFTSFRIFGDSLSVGNTLMRNLPTQPLVNSVLLDSSTARVSGVPAGADVEGAFVFWSGSTDPDFGVDRAVRLTAPSGASQVVRADTCFEATGNFGGPGARVDFYYCRADVTAFVGANPAGSSYNGTYRLGGVAAEAGLLDASGECIDPLCQAFYAGWSMVMVWSHDDEATMRDVVLFDGFELLDETQVSAGVDSYTISGFDVADPPEATFRFFALEGDPLLGVPPQDSDPLIGCDVCFDYLAFNGTKLSDSTNPPNNVFNSTLFEGSAIGVDIDAFDVSSYVRAGDASVRIELGSGDGDPRTGHENGAGGGELFLMGYNVLTINRLAPNFRNRDTFITADPTEAAPGEIIFYTVQVDNDGSIGASDVSVRVPLPPNTEYVAGSTRLDGVVVADVGGGSPLFPGMSLGDLPAGGDSDRRITFRLRVAADTPNGTVIRATATIDAAELTEPTVTEPALVTVVAPSLLAPHKTFLDLDGGLVEPGDFVTYTVRLRKDADRSAAALTFTDDISRFASLQSVNAGSFTDESTLTGGAGGTGRVLITDISMPVGSTSAVISYTVRIFDAAELADRGVDPADIDGLVVSNQGALDADFLPAALLTDDPSTADSPDPTDITLTSAVNLRNSGTFKRGDDLDGGLLEPGDTIRYTISLRNTGNQDAFVDLQDPLPAWTTNPRMVATVAGVTLLPPPAGTNGTGELRATSLAVAAASTVSIVVDVDVADDAPNGTGIANVASVRVPEFPAQSQRLESTPLVVVSGPDFGDATKVAVDSTAGFEPGDTVEWEISFTNEGIQSGEDVRVTDVIARDLTAVVPADGGVYDPGSRTIAWSLGGVDVGERRTVRFAARIGVGVADGTRIANQAFVSASGLEGQPTDDPATATADDPTVIVVAALPVVVAEKTVSDVNGGSFEPGDPIQWRIVVRNDGRAAATNVSVIDPLPAGSLSAFTPGQGGSIRGGTVSWSATTTPALASIAPGGSVVLTVDATLATALTDGEIVANQARVSADGAIALQTDDPTTVAPDDATRLVIAATADLSATEKLVVDANGGATQPGDLLTWTIRLVNEGTGPARDVIVTDAVPTGLTDIVPAAGGAFDPSSGLITWTPSASVPAGGSLELSFTSRVAAGVANGTAISNQAFVESPDLADRVLTDDPSTPAVDDATTVIVESRPDFATSTKEVFSADGTGEFRPGDDAVYRITVRNTGTEDATGVVVTDNVDPSFASVEAGEGGTVSGGAIRWNVGALASGAEVTLGFRATLGFPLDDGTEVSNQAFIGAPGVEPVPTDDPTTPDEDDPTVFTVSARSDLSATMKTFIDVNGGSVEPGDRIEWVIVVANSGTDAAAEVDVTDVVAANLVDIDPGDAVWDPSTRTLRWNSATTPGLGRVTPGDAGAVELRFAATVGSPIENGTFIANQAQLAVGADTFVSDDPSTSEVGDPTRLQVISSFDLGNAIKVAGAPGPTGYRPGDIVTWSFRFSNTGSSVARNAVLTDTLDSNLEFVGATEGGVYDGTSVRWDATTTPALAALEIGEVVELQLETRIVARLPDGTRIANQGSLTAEGAAAPFVTDDPMTDEEDDATEIVVDASATLAGTTKTIEDLDGDGVFEPGDTVRYVITVTNGGDGAATNVSVRDRVPVELTGVTAMDGGRIEGDELVWTAETTPALASVTPGDDGAVLLRIEGTIRPDIPSGTAIANQAMIAHAAGEVVRSDDPTTDEPDDPTVVVVGARADFTSSTKTVTDLDGGFLLPGDRVRYEIQLVNSGQGTGAGVSIVDEVDPSLVDLLPLDGGVVGGRGTSIVWDATTNPALAVVPPGETLTLRFEATVADVPNGTAIANQAFVTDVGGDAVPTDDPSTPEPADPTVVVVSAPELDRTTLAVTDLNGGLVEPGDTLEYRIWVSAGDGPALSWVVAELPISPWLEELVPDVGGAWIEADRVVRWAAVRDPRLADVSGDEEVELVLRATVASDAPRGTLIEEQGFLFCDEVPDGVVTDDPSTPEEDDPTVVQVLGSTVADLSATTKTVEDVNGGLVEPGDVLTYVILVPNDGVGAARSVTVADALPPFTSFVADSLTVDGVSVAGGENPIAEGLVLGDLDVGEAFEVAFSVRVDDDALAGDRIDNVAFVSEEGGAVTRSDDPSTPEEDDPTSVIVGSAPELSRTVKAAEPAGGNDDGVVQHGETVHYVIDIPNRGTEPAVDVVFVDPLPTNATYTAGTLRLDGASLSDEEDDDAGVVDGGEVRVRIGVIEPGSTARVEFDVVPVEGDELANQGVVAFRGGSEATDDDGDPTNGDAPTVTPLEGATALSVTKVAIDADGGTVDPGDLVTYAITFRATGNIDEPATFVDVPDPGVTLTEVVALPAGVDVTFDELGVWLTVGTLADGEERIVLLQGVLDAGLEDGTVVCNRIARDDAEVAEPACLGIGGRAGLAEVQGTVFRELGAANGTFDADTDEPMGDFLVRLVRPGLEEFAVEEAVSDSDGTFSLSARTPGDYVLQVFANGGPDFGGASFGADPVALPGGTRLRRDVLIDPTGVVWNSDSRSPVAGVRVWLYRSGSGTKDALDETRIVDAALLPQPSQQGQVVPSTGVYRFDLPQTGSYELFVDTAGTSYVFPSTRIPPTESVVEAGLGERVEVVEAAVPGEVAEGDERYGLVVAAGTDGGVFKNHLPVDAIESDIVLTKRADRVSAHVGDIITYTITVRNDSGADLVHDVEHNVGGILVSDAIPRTFRYVDGSAVGRLRDLSTGQSSNVSIYPRGELLLDFATAHDGDWGPIDLPDGTELEIRYFLVVGSDTDPGRHYRNRAEVRSGDTHRPLSNVDWVDVRIDYDPVFDQGVLIGRAFCDEDGDGRHDRGERPLPGARIYLDTGYYTETDSEGQYHFSDIDPGLHLLKIDTDTLPVGSTVVSDEARAFDVTRGLPSQIDFGVSCAENLVTELDVLPGDGALAEAARLRRLRYFEVAADVYERRVAIDEVPIPLLAARMSLAAGEPPGFPVDTQRPSADEPDAADAGESSGDGAEPGDTGAGLEVGASTDVSGVTDATLPSMEPVDRTVVDLRVADGALVRPLGASLDIPADADRWVFELVEAESGLVAWQRVGTDGGVVRFAWDGRDAEGALVLAPERTYEARLRATAGESRYAAAMPVLVRVADTRLRYLVEERVHGELFDGTRPNAELVAMLEGMRDDLARTSPHRILVEAHLDDRDEVENEDETTQAQAEVVARYLVSELGIPPRRIEPRGHGVRRPLYPNIGDRTRNTNRRIEVKVVDPDPEIVVPEVPDVAPVTPGIRLGQRFIGAEGDGTVALSAPKPADGLVVATVVDIDGNSGATLVTLRDGVQLERGRTTLPEIAVRVDVEGDRIGIGEATASIGALNMRVETMEPVGYLAGRMLEPTMRFPFVGVPDGVDAWTFEVFEVGGGLVFDDSGSGPPPGGKRWQGRTSDGVPLEPGAYEARLTVRLVGGAFATSPPTRFEIVEAGTEAPAAAPDVGAGDVVDDVAVVRVNGQRLDGDGGLFQTTVRASTGSTILIDIMRGGGRLVLPVTVPQGHEARYETTVPITPFSILVDPLAAPDVPSSAGPVPPAPTSTAPASTAPAGAQPDSTPFQPVEGTPSPSGPRTDPGNPFGPAADPFSPASGSPAEQVEPPASSPAPASGESSDDEAEPDGESPSEREPTSTEPAPVDSEPAEDEAPNPFSPMSGGRWLLARPSAMPSLMLRQSNDPFSPFEPDDSGGAPDSATGSRPGGSTPADTGVGSSMPSTTDGVSASDAAPSDAESAAVPPSYAGIADFYATELDAALSTDADDLAAALAASDAAQISVQLPPQGVPLPTNRLSVFGTTVPTNRVMVNGTEVRVGSDGRFDTIVDLPGGESVLVVETEDTEGNHGTLEWPIEVARSSLFLMALGDTAVGSRHSEIAGAHEHNSTTTDGGAVLYGQARLYLKGWISGEEILSGHWDDIDVTAHIDTGKRREYESFVRETIQPDRQYPVFGDSSEQVSDVNSSGKVYVLVSADESTATWGNFNADIQGVELLRYERNLYGAQIELDETLADDYRTELQVHVADEDADVVQTYNFMRGTGGSIYYLQNRQVVEGSERVTIVVRDSISGIELARFPQSRNADYTIRYREGRIIMKSPVPSVADDGLLLGQYTASRSTLDGNAVYIEVSYDYEGGRNASDLSYGAHARETVYDFVSIGGGIVEESRAGAPGYSLWGIEIGVGPTESTRVDFEYAGSSSDDLGYAYSDDGGLTFDRFRLDDTEDAEGNAVLVRGAFELADVLETDRDRIWSVGGYYQETDRGFFSNGRILDQGEEKFGFSSRLLPADSHTLSFRLDRVTSLVDDLETDDLSDTARIRRQVSLAQYDYDLDPARFSLSYEHTFADDARLDDAYTTDIVGTAVGVQILRWLRAGVGQEFIVAGDDPRVVRGSDGDGETRFEDRFITAVEVGIRVAADLEIVGTERFRYSGEHSALIGLNAAVNEDSDVYLQQRFRSERDNRGSATTTVVGGEQRFGDHGSGRTYGEYHMDTGVSGQRSRAVLGFGKRWNVADGLSLDVGYERSEVLADESSESASRRNTGSFGWEYVGTDELKLSGLFEARFDNGSFHTPAVSPCLGGDITGNPEFCRDRLTSVGDRRQLVSLTTVEAKPTPDVTVFGRFDIVVTENTTLDLLESRDVEGTAGVALRPVDFNWINLLMRYTYLGEMAPYQLELDQRRDERSHVFSLSPIFQLPYDLQLVEKIAVRHIELDVEGMPRVDNDLVLLINRLNYRVFRRWDVGGEYRFLRQSLTQDWRHGLLLDVNYIVAEHVRLGFGYNFTRFAEDELGDFDRDNSGVFFRVAAQY